VANLLTSIIKRAAVDEITDIKDKGNLRARLEIFATMME